MNETTGDTALAGRNNALVRCCLTCNHWSGDKEKQWDLIKKHGDIVMDFNKGWPETGPCEIQHNWSDLQIDGDATVTLEVDACFGCVAHEC